jgi:hypothetical protein
MVVFHGVSQVAEKDPSALRRGINGLQSLLAIALYHSQPKGYSEPL